MTVKEFMRKNPRYGMYQITFIKVKARKDKNTPFYHPEYETTPLFYGTEVHTLNLSNYLILNHEQPCIQWLSGANWRGAKCMLIISRKDLAKLYPSKGQRAEMLMFIDAQIEHIAECHKG